MFTDNSSPQFLPSTANAMIATLFWLLVIPLFGVHVHSGEGMVLPVVHSHDKHTAHDRDAPEIPRNGMPKSPSDLLFTCKLPKDDMSAERIWSAHAIIITRATVSHRLHYFPFAQTEIGKIPPYSRARFNSIRAPPAT